MAPPGNLPRHIRAFALTRPRGRPAVTFAIRPGWLSYPSPRATRPPDVYIRRTRHTPLRITLLRGRRCARSWEGRLRSRRVAGKEPGGPHDQPGISTHPRPPSHQTSAPVRSKMVPGEPTRENVPTPRSYTSNAPYTAAPGPPSVRPRVRQLHAAIFSYPLPRQGLPPGKEGERRNWDGWGPSRRLALLDF